MNEHDPVDPIDRLLDDAFRSRSVPPVSRPSVIDVQHRARRRQHRRSGAMLGALAVVGVGGAIAVAARHDGSDRIALTPGGTQAGVATTVACFTVPTTMWVDPATNSSPAPSPTTYPPTTLSFNGTTTTNAVQQYVVSEGDVPAVVAQKFAVSLDELNAANSATLGYDAFTVGLSIIIPFSGGTVLEPTVVPSTSPFGYLPGDPCAPSSGGSYHCTGPLGTYSDGAQMFSECVFWPDFMPATTSFDPAITEPPTAAPTTTYTECPPNANCVLPGYPFDSTTTTSVEVSPNSFVPCDFPPVTSPVTTTCDSGAVVPVSVAPTSALVTSTTALP